MHRGQVATRDPPLKPEALRLKGQRLDMAAEGVVAFVAMHVHTQTPRRRNLAEFPNRGRAIRHGAFEMRNAAHHIDAHVQGADRVGAGGRVAVEPVLRKGHKLQVDVVFDLVAHLQHGRHALKAVVAGVDMAANRQEAHGGGPIAILQSAGNHLFLRDDLFEFAPEADPFQERARSVDARQAIA